jgi:molybdopterin-binding protein
MPLLAVRDAAGQLGVTYSTLKRWIHQGSVRTVRTEGGHHRVPVEEVDRLLTARGEPVKRRTRPPAHGVLVALSGRNQLRGIVDEVRTEGLLAQVRMRIGDQILTAVITRDAVRELKLRRGDNAVAIVKSTEVMIGREQADTRANTPTKGGKDRKRPK